MKFIPRATAFENVVEQVKSGTVAYSLFALARLFLEKAPRHDVKLAAPPETSLFQLGENGAISVDRNFLERNAFRFGQADFYKIEVTETEPIKGNFTNVARDRLSGTLLGPTNHHDYQRRLRNLYEQRFSRRMSFSDFQRQIQIVTDPAEIEKWKEEARKVTTYSTLREEPPVTFSSVTEAERHFEKNYLPGIVKPISEVVVDGPASRQMHDRVLNKVIENEWNRETRSPSRPCGACRSGGPGRRPRRRPRRCWSIRGSGLSCRAATLALAAAHGGTPHRHATTPSAFVVGIGRSDRSCQLTAAG